MLAAAMSSNYSYNYKSSPGPLDDGRRVNMRSVDPRKTSEREHARIVRRSNKLASMRMTFGQYSKNWTSGEWDAFGLKVKGGSAHLFYDFRSAFHLPKENLAKAIFSRAQDDSDARLQLYATNYLKHVFSDQQRLVLMLRENEGLGVVETAKRLDLSHQSVCILYRRAYRKMEQFSPDVLF